MTENNQPNYLRDYFTACFLAVAASLLSLARTDAFGRGGVWIIGVFALGMVVMMYVRTRPSAGDESTQPDVPLRRLRRMAVLWYALSGVLGAAFIKDHIQQWNLAGAKAWILSVIGAAVIFVSVARIAVVLRK